MNSPSTSPTNPEKQQPATSNKNGAKKSGFFSRLRSIFQRNQSPEPQPSSSTSPLASKEKQTQSRAKTKDIAQAQTPDWLIIGLGNPGAQYAHTRHNAGIDAVDLDPITWEFSKLGHADIAYANAANSSEDASNTPTIAYVRSHFYMNESGRTIEKLQRLWNLPLERIVVVHDELDLPLGKVRIKQGGSHNGHNGLKSIDAALGSPKYIRIRVGIGRPATGVSVVDHVLGPLPAGDLTEQGLQLAHEAVEYLPTHGLAKTQNLIHRK